MVEFIRYIFNLIIKPKDTFQNILIEPKRFKYTAIFLIILEILYTLTMIGYTVAGIKIFYPTFTKIPAEDLHFWDIFLTAPVTFLCLIMIIGLIYLLSKLFKGKGKYEDIFIISTFAVTLPFYAAWFFDTIMLVLTIIANLNINKSLSIFFSKDTNKIILNMIYMIPCLLWNHILLTKGILLVEKIKKIQANLISIINVVFFWGIMFLILF